MEQDLIDDVEWPLKRLTKLILSSYVTLNLNYICGPFFEYENSIRKETTTHAHINGRRFSPISFPQIPTDIHDFSSFLFPCLNSFLPTFPFPSPHHTRHFVFLLHGISDSGFELCSRNFLLTLLGFRPAVSGEPPTQTFENKKKKILLKNPEKPETISGFVRKFEKVRFREQTCWPKNFGRKTRAFDFQ
ncbi:hypothetical protein CEXT_404961 [Caerostris extrusa]|uniref:Uncharacterized protein n=1 Tax=Caerostris extrusa TaxID=172846 RepID=A0AAV4NSS0_CAEEX|nr:hypothetical protein CEXT_404961 [Caerostris extrusa]